MCWVPLMGWGTTCFRSSRPWGLWGKPDETNQCVKVRFSRQYHVLTLWLNLAQYIHIYFWLCFDFDLLLDSETREGSK